MTAPKKKVSILGSTGSIGLNSLEVIGQLSDNFEVISASCHANWSDLAQQVRTNNMKKAVITDTSHLEALKSELADTDVEVLGGPEYLIDLASDPECDIVIVSIVGAAGLPAVLAATRAGKTVAIANKESLVVAGCLVMPLATESGATILPIDSEHSAILQSMHSGDRHEVDKIIITASGGPFRRSSIQEIRNASLSDALNHPTWDMGPKITIDSATMMNKALEIIEARWLFDISADNIDVVVHPESIIHSMVEFCDGSVIAQLSRPDMRLPIQYALTYPQRSSRPHQRLNLEELGSLTFEKPDLDRFPAVRLGFETAQRGGTAGAVLNAANEAAVEAFRSHKIKFIEIVELTEECLRNHNWIEKPGLEELTEADNWARRQVGDIISKKGRV